MNKDTGSGPRGWGGGESMVEQLKTAFFIVS